MPGLVLENEDGLRSGLVLDEQVLLENEDGAKSVEGEMGQVHPPLDGSDRDGLKPIRAKTFPADRAEAKTNPHEERTFDLELETADLEDIDLGVEEVETQSVSEPHLFLFVNPDSGSKRGKRFLELMPKVEVIVKRNVFALSVLEGVVVEVVEALAPSFHLHDGDMISAYFPLPSSP